jgi:hypothetical protein
MGHFYLPVVPFRTLLVMPQFAGFSPLMPVFTGFSVESTKRPVLVG